MKSLHFAIIILAMFIAGCKGAKKQSTVEVIEAPATIDIVNFNADSAYKYVKTQADFGPRAPGSTGHAACADYLINSLSRYGSRHCHRAAGCFEELSRFTPCPL